MSSNKLCDGIQNNNLKFCLLNIMDLIVLRLSSLL